MSTYKISQLRDLFNDWETGLDQAVTLVPLFPIEVIDEYWSMGWMQNPANPDDRWKSDWIRAVLMAYAPQGSLPHEAKKQDRIRHSKSFAGNTTDKVNELELTSEWSHLSEFLLHDIIKNLGVTQLEFRSSILFENYLKNPADVTQIKVYIGKDWNVKTTTIIDTNLAQTISEKIPRGIENLELHIDDNYDINFNENSLLNFAKLKLFDFRGNCKKGVLNFTNNNLLEEIKITLKNEEDTLNVKGLNNCLQLKKIYIKPESNCTINLEPVDLNKFSNLYDFNLSNTSYFSDIKGIIKEELCLERYRYGEGNGVEGVKNIDIELIPDKGYHYNKVKLVSVFDLETLKIKGEANDIELKELPKLKEVNLDLQGAGKTIFLDFSRALESKPQIKAHQLKLQV